MGKPLSSVVSEPKTTVEKLSELLTILDIKSAYYVDDYNNIDYWSIAAAYSVDLFTAGKLETLVMIYEDNISLNVPDEDVFRQNLSTFWEGLSSESQKQIFIKIHKVLEIEFSTLDFERTKALQESFPGGVLKCINPDEWEELLKDLNIKSDGKILILFDQDLKNAQGDRFRSGTIKGQNLIRQVKKSAIWGSVYCGLITHIISKTSEELPERDKIIAESGDELVRGDFLALTKERIKNPELLCDGIKKTLLNRYFESVKDKSISLIEKARTNTSMLFQALDTYDFDTTILRSSYNEGVWEGNTIFRIVNNIYEEEVKKLMINLNYPKIINPILKLSKEISDVEFEIEPEKEPYKQKYKLRHQDIYENGDHINKLFLPIENGDIFEITDGTGKGYYILIGQECDLMMREKGSRGSQFSTLAKINLMNKDQYVAELAKNNNYLANKFELYYFEEGTTKVGIVSFLTTSNVDFNMLDLCVFNEEGESKLDITKQFDTDLLSTSWENRYKKIIKGCTSEAKKLDMLLSEIKARNLPATVRDPIVKSILPNLGIFSPIGKSDSYENNIFNFGFRRVRRLKSFHAKYLLERYYRHLSRTAEPHDFASN